MEEQKQETNHVHHQHPQSVQQPRYNRAYAYMKRPEFLLLLGLVNLLLILCVSSKIHRVMHFNKMGYGHQQMHMMQKWHMMRGNQGYSRTIMLQWRPTQQVQYQEAQDMDNTNQAQPNDAVMTQPETDNR